MSLKEITLKLAMLLALTSGQRVQTLATLSKKGMIHSDGGVGFVLTGLLKRHNSFQYQPKVRASLGI